MLCGGKMSTWNAVFFPLLARCNGQRGGFTIVEPKTTRSRRQIALSSSAIDTLAQHRKTQTAERLQCGSLWEDSDLVFTNAMGKPIHTSDLRVDFLRILREAQLPQIRFHDLRHTAATLLLSQGVHPKITSEMLGHSTIAITLDLYSHVTSQMQREAANAMDAIFSVPQP